VSLEHATWKLVLLQAVTMQTGINLLRQRVIAMFYEPGGTWKLVFRSGRPTAQMFETITTQNLTDEFFSTCWGITPGRT
jgi:hypothetical protein